MCRHAIVIGSVNTNTVHLDRILQLPPSRERYCSMSGGLTCLRSSMQAIGPKSDCARKEWDKNIIELNGLEHVQ